MQSFAKLHSLRTLLNTNVDNIDYISQNQNRTMRLTDENNSNDNNTKTTCLCTAKILIMAVSKYGRPYTPKNIQNMRD